MKTVHTIELDCPPGSPRPDDLLPSVIEGTGLPIVEASSRFFGNWTFVFHATEEEWQKIKPTLEQAYQSALRARGVIRELDALELVFAMLAEPSPSPCQQCSQ